MRLHIQFVRYCDRYDICEAALIASQDLSIERKHDYLMEYEDEIVFAFDMLHKDNECLKALSKRMVLMICDQDIKEDRAELEELLCGNPVITGQAMKVFLAEPRVADCGRRLSLEDHKLMQAFSPTV